MDHTVIVDDEKGVAKLGKHAKFCFCTKDGSIMPSKAIGRTKFAIVFQFNKEVFPPDINFDTMFKDNCFNLITQIFKQLIKCEYNGADWGGP